MEKLRLNKAKYLGQVYYTNKEQKQNPHQDWVPESGLPILQ